MSHLNNYDGWSKATIEEICNDLEEGCFLPIWKNRDLFKARDEFYKLREQLTDVRAGTRTQIRYYEEKELARGRAERNSVGTQNNLEQELAETRRALQLAQAETNKVHHVQDELTSLEARLVSAKKIANAKDIELAHLKAELAGKKAQLQDAEEMINDLAEGLYNADIQFEAKAQQLREMNIGMASKDQKLGHLTTQLEATAGQLSETNVLMAGKDQELADVTTQLQIKDGELSKFKELCDTKLDELLNLQIKCDNQHVAITHMQQTLAQHSSKLDNLAAMHDIDRQQVVDNQDSVRVHGELPFFDHLSRDEAMMMQQTLAKHSFKLDNLAAKHDIDRQQVVDNQDSIGVHGEQENVEDLLNGKDLEAVDESRHQVIFEDMNDAESGNNIGAQDAVKLEAIVTVEDVAPVQDTSEVKLVAELQDTTELNDVVHEAFEAQNVAPTDDAADNSTETATGADFPDHVSSSDEGIMTPENMSIADEEWMVLEISSDE
jgi:predicted  nucleic acid-binding Zn-ribbon protein